MDASPAARHELQRVLSEAKLSLGDWFEARVLEEAADYVGNEVPEAPVELNRLTDLRSPESVLDRLSSVDWAFGADDTGYLSHDLHPYAAKFVPQIPATLISALSLPGELVWDPFGGSGTTALEAALRGRRAVSTDANPLAEVIGKAKTCTPTQEDISVLMALRERVLLLARLADPLSAMDNSERGRILEATPSIPNIDKWFHPHATAELAALRVMIHDLPVAARPIATVAFSKIIVRASFQDSETRYSSKPRDVLPGATLKLFAGELGVALARVRRLGMSLQFRRAMFATVDLRQHVVRNDGQAMVAPNSVSLIVTSPPYPNSMDYHLYHRFRLYWLGFDPRELGKIEIGSHLRHQRERSGIDNYLAEMQAALSNCHEALQLGRYAAVVIGDCTYDGVRYKTSDHLARVAETIGFEVVGVVKRRLPGTKRSFIPPARKLVSEDVLLLRKRPGTYCVRLQPPPYRLWPYEDHLRLLEARSLLGETVESTGAGQALTAIVDCYELDRARRLTFTHSIDFDSGAAMRTWQATLENGDAGDFSARKDPKYVTHGVHPYKGKFYPQLAKALFNMAGLAPGSRVLDPYCGSGTVLLEAQLNGLYGVGFDINPLAVHVASAKCAVLTEDHVIVDHILSRLAQRLQQLSGHGRDPALGSFVAECLPELESWFARPVLEKLSWCLREIAAVPVPAVQALLRVTLSSVIRDVSQQDPQDLRIRRRSEPLVDAPVHELFLARLTEARRRLADFAARLDRCPSRLHPTVVRLQDVAAGATPEVLREVGGEFDAVVTSPPYATALPYVDAYRLNMLSIWGLTSQERAAVEQQTIGSREISARDRIAIEREATTSDELGGLKSAAAGRLVQQLLAENLPETVGFRRMNMAALIFRYFRAMSASMANVDRAIRPGAQVFLVVGDNQTVTGRGPVRIATTRVLTEIGSALGWELTESIPITVTKENYRHSRNTITENTVLWMTKRSVS